MKTIILFPILLFLLFHVTFVNCAYNATAHTNSINSTNSTNSATNSDPDVTNADSKLMIVTGLILSQIDLIACIYVIVRTYLQWKQIGKNPLPMSLRFPFYIVLLETWVSILQTVGFASSSPTGEYGQLCSIIGLFSIFLLGFTGNLVTFISFIIWYKVKKNVNFNSGRYDYLLFLSSSVLATFYTLLGVGEYGPSKFWCSPNPLKKPILYMILTIILIHFLILLILYVNTRINLIRLNINLSSSNGQALSERELIISKKSSSYTLTFVFQLTILLLCAIFAASVTSENSAIRLLRMLGMSIGGLLIALQYIINEGWKHEKITSSPLIEKNSPGLQSTVSSIRDSIQRLPFTRIQVQVVQQTTTQNDEIW